MQVITETLRMGNIINGIMRKAVRDVEVRGHLIPKGWRVLVYFRAVHLDAAVHDDPHAFNPWRWKDRADVMTGGGGGFTPFGGGQRLCPGLDLARLEASIFLHHLVTNFRYGQRPLRTCVSSVNQRKRCVHTNAFCWTLTRSMRRRLMLQVGGGGGRRREVDGEVEVRTGGGGGARRGETRGTSAAAEGGASRRA